MKAVQKLRALLAGATAGPLDIGVYADDADPVEMHREHLSYGSGPVWLVWAPEHPATVGTRDALEHAAVVCNTGNGPASEANARLIAAAFPALRELLAVVEAACEVDWANSRRARELVGGGEITLDSEAGMGRALDGVRLSLSALEKKLEACDEQ